MQRYEFEQLDDDTLMLGLGSLFRRLDGSRWGINIDYLPYQKKPALTISNAPVLARRRVLNPTVPTKKAGWHESFCIQDTSDWLVKKISDWPGPGATNKIETNQFCFVFKLPSGLTVFLPQFELARALFFHDGYLSRSALESDCLTAEFDIVVDEDLDLAVINIMPSAGYALRLLNEPGCRRFLSWVLLDNAARKSFESIGKYQKIFGENRGSYRIWDFQFEPPSLPAAQFKVRGKFDSQSNCLFVYEIDSIKNLKADMPSNIEFYHPGFEQQVRGEGKSGGVGSSELLTETYIHDDSEASSETKRFIIHPDTIDIAFDKVFKTSKIPKKKRLTGSGSKEESTSEATGHNVSVDEPSTTGKLPGADWNNINDVSDRCSSVPK